MATPFAANKTPLQNPVGPSDNLIQELFAPRTKNPNLMTLPKGAVAIKHSRVQSNVLSGSELPGRKDLPVRESEHPYFAGAKRPSKHPYESPIALSRQSSSSNLKQNALAQQPFEILAPDDSRYNIRSGSLRYDGSMAKATRMKQISITQMPDISEAQSRHRLKAIEVAMKSKKKKILSSLPSHDNLQSTPLNHSPSIMRSNSKLSLKHNFRNIDIYSRTIPKSRIAKSVESSQESSPRESPLSRIDEDDGRYHKNFADIKDVVGKMSKGTNLNTNANQEWILGLRNKGRNEPSNFSGKKHFRSEKPTYDPTLVPSVYYKDSKLLDRQKKAELDYQGNFYDISHLTKRTIEGKGGTELAQAHFAAHLRTYDPQEQRSSVKKQQPQQQSYDSNDSAEKRKKRFSLNFSKERPVLDHNYKIGSTFLPPINNNCQKVLSQVPVLKVAKGMRKKVIEDSTTSGTAESQSRVRKGQAIHSFDPSNLSMPKYSSKYRNEVNAGAVRHLLGGRNFEGANQADIRSSAIHWQLGLRYYDPGADLKKRDGSRSRSNSPE